MSFEHSIFLKAPLVFGTGSNVIGILPGKNWKHPKDRPIVVGAHWDTVPNSPGKKGLVRI